MPTKQAKRTKSSKGSRPRKSRPARAGDPDQVPPPEVVEAMAFKVVDAQGQVRAELGLSDDGVLAAPQLRLNDSRNGESLSLGWSAAGEPQLMMRDAAGRTKMWIICRANGSLAAVSSEYPATPTLLLPEVASALTAHCEDNDLDQVTFASMALANAIEANGQSDSEGEAVALAKVLIRERARGTQCAGAV